jgi:hypothetical protein
MSVVVAIAIATGMVAPRASAMVGPAAGAGADDRHRDEGNRLMDDGGKHQEAGEHAEAARAYAKAFDAFAQRSKSDAKEMQAVSLAVDEFKLAQDTEPRSLVLLEEEAALLERSIARAKGEGALPDWIEEERSRVKGRIEALEREAAERKTTPVEPTPEVEPAPEVEPTPYLEPAPEVEPAPEPDRRSRREAGAILASGVVGIMGGAGLVGAGAWTWGAADERRDAHLAALDADEYPDEDGLREDLEQWHRRGRGIGTGLLVSGAVLAAAGIGLTAWGAVKLRRAAKGSSTRARVVLPMVGPDGVGVVARVAF